MHILQCEFKIVKRDDLKFYSGNSHAGSTRLLRELFCTTLILTLKRSLWIGKFAKSNSSSSKKWPILFTADFGSAPSLILFASALTYLRNVLTGQSVFHSLKDKVFKIPIGLLCTGTHTQLKKKHFVNDSQNSGPQKSTFIVQPRTGFNGCTWGLRSGGCWRVYTGARSAAEGILSSSDGNRINTP